MHSRAIVRYGRPGRGRFRCADCGYDLRVGAVKSLPPCPRSGESPHELHGWRPRSRMPWVALSIGLLALGAGAWARAAGTRRLAREARLAAEAGRRLAEAGLHQAERGVRRAQRSARSLVS